VDAVEVYMTKNFDSLFRSREGGITIELGGEIDGSAAAEVCYRIQMLGVSECSLDFSRVEVIDLFGAQVLARGLKALRQGGIRLEIEGLWNGVSEKLCLGGVLEAIV
jgi:anti-anti-sigma regulatory factor